MESGVQYFRTMYEDDGLNFWGGLVVGFII